MTPEVTVCMTVYKSEASVRTAIESVLAQTFQNFIVLISVDPSTDASADICREYAAHPKVTVDENETRLGWVGNMNACLDRICTPFFAFCHNDDELSPVFLERLYPLLRDNPTASAAFGAIERHGAQNVTVQPANCVGSPAERAMACLKGNMPAYGLKNLMRSEPVLSGLRLPVNGELGYCSDWPFALEYSLAGEFLSVPEVLYRKAFHKDSASAKWSEISSDLILKYVVTLQLQMLRAIGAADLDIADRQLLVHRVLHLLPVANLRTAMDVQRYADDVDFSIPTLLIAELLGEGADPLAELANPVNQFNTAAAFRQKIAGQIRQKGGRQAALAYARQAQRLADRVGDSSGGVGRNSWLQRFLGRN